MAAPDRFARRLAEQARRGPGGRARVTLRAVLAGLGHTRRSKAVVASVRRTLSAHGLSIDFGVDSPPTLDDEVSVELAALVHAFQPAPAPTPLRPAVDMTAAAQCAIAATIEVRVRSADGDSSGAGFIIDPDGIAITACHVVSVSGLIVRRARMRLASRRRTMGTVVRAHPKLDFAVLWLDLPGPHPFLPPGDPSALLPAEQVLAVGHPGILSETGEVETLRSTVTTGTVANPGASLAGVEWIQMNTDIDPGNSGGPLVDAAGQAVGVNVWKASEIGAGKMALPIDYLLGDIAEAMRMGRQGAGRGWLCPLCGWLDLGRRRWFCRNCGATRNHESED